MKGGVAGLPVFGWPLLLFPLYYLFHGLAAFGLLNNVEGMYAEIAREMLASGNWSHWIIPQLNDVPYIEKPPLLYWLTALSLRAFGVHDWAVRLVPAGAGVFLLVTVAWFGRELKGWRYAVLSVFVLGSSAGFLMMSRVALTDALLSELLNASVLLTYIGLVQQRRSVVRAASLCLALATLTKGLVALVLFGLIGLSYLAWRRRADWRMVLCQLCDPWAIALFLAVLLPWHIAAALTLPEFSWFYFVNEHLYRFLGIREPHDYYSGGFFYYVPRLALMFLPWVPLVALAFFPRRESRTRDQDLRQFLSCCVLVPLVFFSISSAKANYYAVVCLPGLALLTALMLEHRIEQHASVRFERLVWVSLLLVGIALIPFEQYVLRYGAQTETSFSARNMAAEIQRRAASGEALPVFLYQDYEDYSSLPFYLQSTVGIVDTDSDDLRFGRGLGAGGEHFLTVEQFMSYGAGRHAVWLVVLDPAQRQFAKSPLANLSVQVVKTGDATLYRFGSERS